MLKHFDYKMVEKNWDTNGMASPEIVSKVMGASITSKNKLYERVKLSQVAT